MAKRKNAPSTPNVDTSSNNDSKEKLIFVLPGDNVSQYIKADAEATILLGTGLQRRRQVRNDDSDSDNLAVYATLSGCLQYTFRTTGGKKKKQSHVYWIRSSNSTGRNSSLQLQDRVVGIIQERAGPDGAGGDYYRVLLGNADTTALLSNLNFEGATRRNKPTLELGQVLYARIDEWVPGLEPVLSCKLGPHDSAAVKTKDWMTNEGIYGVLQGGTVLTVSTGLARILLTPKGVVLWDSVSKHELTSAFEIAIGVNGLIWLHASPSPQAIVVLQNAILNSQLLTPEQTAGMVQQLVHTMRKQIQRELDAN
mmetsp:Transcript_7217/g.9378  ORF Transcript_7217/g.9378 Transcript_7217/m.9378 type:complete len:310 (-) Transcript_7217:159-1088(-)